MYFVCKVLFLSQEYKRKYHTLKIQINTNKMAELVSKPQFEMWFAVALVGHCVLVLPETDQSRRSVGRGPTVEAE